MTTETDDLTLLSETLVDGITTTIESWPEDTAIAPEFEVGDPSGVFVGIADCEEGEGDALVYVYVADIDRHCQVDDYGTTGERQEYLYEETLQLNRLSTELLYVLDGLVDGISPKEDKFQRVGDTVTPEDGPECGMGAYYTLQFSAPATRRENPRSQRE